MSDYYGPLSIACPACGAPVGKRCRTLTTNRSTDMHVARFEAFYAPRRGNDQ